MEIWNQFIAGWWQLNFWGNFHSENWGRWTHFDFFSDGLKPPTGTNLHPPSKKNSIGEYEYGGIWSFFVDRNRLKHPEVLQECLVLCLKDIFFLQFFLGSHTWEFWTVGLIVVALIGLQLENSIFLYIGSLIMQVSKCVPHKITTHPTGKTAPHLRFSKTLLAVLEVMSTQNSCLMLSLQQGFSRHFFKVIVSYNSRGWSRGTLLGCSNHWTQPFHHPRHPKLVAGSPGCSQCCCLMSCYLGCFVVRREARESSVLGMRCGGGSPKVPDGMLRVPRRKFWVHTFFSKSLVRTEQLQHLSMPCDFAGFWWGRMPKQSKVRTWMWCDHWQLM